MALPDDESRDFESRRYLARELVFCRRMKSIIVTADDYGLHEAVNAAVHRLASTCAIDRVSVMVHQDAVLDQATALSTMPVKTGLHLVLVEERPLRPESLHGLIDKRGRLPPNWRALLRTLSMRPWLLPPLRDEIEAQLQRYLKLGLPLEFVNSHQHVHSFPPIWILMLKVLADYPGVQVRSAHEQRLCTPRQSALALASKASWALAPAMARLHTSPLGLEMAGHISLPVLKRLRAEVNRILPSESVGLPEIVMHPGDYDSSLEIRYGHWGYEWSREAAALASEAWRGLRLG